MIAVRPLRNAGRSGVGPLCVMVGPSGAAQGGVASVMQVLSDAALFSNGQVRLLTSFSAGSKLDKLRVAVTALGAYLRLLARGQAPVLHVHVSSNASFWRKAVFIWAAVLARRKVVFHLHGGGFRAFVESRGFLARFVVLATIRRSAQLLYLATPVGDWLRSVAPGVPAQWWPNPVPDALFGTNSDQLAKPPVALFLGALLPAKGVADLLVAFAQLQAANPDARLVVAGSGPERAALEAQANRLGLGGQVQFLGWIDAQARVHWLGCARVLVLPSHLEAQPMVLLEAMAAGVPLVSTNVGGIPDIVSDGEDGILVAPQRPDQLAQALCALWPDGRRRSCLAAKARVRTHQRHGAGAVCAALLALYGELSNAEVGR